MQRQGRESWSRSRLPLSLSRGLALGSLSVVRRKLPVTRACYARRFCKKKKKDRIFGPGCAAPSVGSADQIMPSIVFGHERIYFKKLDQNVET